MNKMQHYILAQCKAGQKKNGVEKGARFLLDIISQQSAHTDFTEIPENDFNSNVGYDTLFDIHQQCYKNEQIPVTLGGDHSVGQSTVASSLKQFNGDLLVIWIDAHADINTRFSSNSHNTHGMPVSGLIGIDKLWISKSFPHLEPSMLAYHGIRDLDNFETEVLKALNIKCKTFDEIADLIRCSNNVHISFDVDGLDPSFIDATGTVAQNGITPEIV
jgi:arginase